MSDEAERLPDRIARLEAMLDAQVHLFTEVMATCLNLYAIPEDRFAQRALSAAAGQPADPARQAAIEEALAEIVGQVSRKLEALRSLD